MCQPDREQTAAHKPYKVNKETPPMRGRRREEREGRRERRGTGTATAKIAATVLARGRVWKVRM